MYIDGEVEDTYTLNLIKTRKCYSIGRMKASSIYIGGFVLRYCTESVTFAHYALASLH